MLPPASHPYKGRPVVGPSGHVSPVRPTLPGSSCRCFLLLGYEGSEPPPGADPGHPLYESGAAAVRDGKAARRGFEPRPPRPERGVLPVRRTGIGTGDAIRTRTGQDLSLLSAAIGLRLCAPPGSRTPFPWIKSPVHHRLCLRRSERIAESNPRSQLGRLLLCH